MFESIFSDTLTLESVLLSIIVSLLLGLFVAYIHMKTTKYTKNFIITLSILPLLVQIVMMMVNGNLGTSVAVLGAFSLIRFRSIPGNSREITSIFFAMAIGLATGMGQLILAIMLTIIIGFVLFILSKSKFGEQKISDQVLKITIPETLDYNNVFNDIFNEYLEEYKLFQVKTTSMGSLYELSYKVSLKDDLCSKKLMDDIRVRNGNLKIVLERPMDNYEL